MHFWLSETIDIVVLSEILLIINHFATRHDFAENEKQNHCVSAGMNSQEAMAFQKGKEEN